MIEQEIQMLNDNWDEIVSKAIDTASCQVLRIRQKEEYWQQLNRHLINMAAILLIQFTLLYVYQVVQLKIVQLHQMQALLTIMQS